MKKVLLLIIFLVYTINVNSQSFILGITGNFLTGNKYYSYQFGPALLAECSFESIPISIVGTVRGYISELRKDYLPGYNNNVFSIGASVNYFPINWAIEPYVGFGIFYNSNDIKTGGMRSSVNGNYLYLENADNYFSGDISMGVKFSANTPINFIVEVARTFSKPVGLIKADMVTNEILSKDEIFLFNSLFVKFGLLFQL